MTSAEPPTPRIKRTIANFHQHEKLQLFSRLEAFAMSALKWLLETSGLSQLAIDATSICRSLQQAMHGCAWGWRSLRTAGCAKLWLVQHGRGSAETYLVECQRADFEIERRVVNSEGCLQSVPSDADAPSLNPNPSLAIV
eukprot:1052508-Amphidinium_carterae.1